MQIRATQQGPLEFMPTMMSTMSQQNFQFHEKNIGQSFGSSSNVSQSQQQSIAYFVPGQFKVSNNGTNGFGNTRNVQSPANPISSGFLGKIYLCL